LKSSSEAGMYSSSGNAPSSLKPGEGVAKVSNREDSFIDGIFGEETDADPKKAELTILVGSILPVVA
jgi:hypothetical protein